MVIQFQFELLCLVMSLIYIFSNLLNVPRNLLHMNIILFLPALFFYYFFLSFNCYLFLSKQLPPPFVALASKVVIPQVLLVVMIMAVEIVAIIAG